MCIHPNAILAESCSLQAIPHWPLIDRVASSNTNDTSDLPRRDSSIAINGKCVLLAISYAQNMSLNLQPTLSRNSH